MSDQLKLAESREPAAADSLPRIDFGAQILNGGPSVTNKFRNTQMEQEPGPPPSIHPRSNKPKFPQDTSGPWWPTDTVNPQSPRWPFGKEDAPGGWGVHWFDLPKTRPPGLPPDKPPEPPKPPGPIPDGPIRNPDQIQPPRLADEDARKSININADARSIYLTAGLTGAGMNTAVHMADLYTGSVDPLKRSGAVAYWRDNLSPSQRLVPERLSAFKAADALMPELRTQANAAGQTFERHIRFRTQLLDQLKAQIPADPLPLPDREWYNARVELVRDARQFRAENIMANAGTEAEVQARQKLFTHAEASQIASQADDYWLANRNKAAAQTALTEGEAVRNKASQLLYQAERGSITTGSQAALKGIGSGLLIATGTVIADGILDKALGNSPELSNSAHWGIQGIGMPLLLLSKASMPTKVLGSLAMVGASHLLDKQVGPPTGIFSPFSRPSLPEIGLATAGALVPFRDPRLRAGLAVGGWLAGKAWNYADARYELTGRTEPRLRDETAAALSMDLKGPSSERFLFAASEMRKFSDRNEAASAVLIKDWQGSNSGGAATSIEKQRASAALMLGFGESMMTRGSRIDQDKWDKNGVRLGGGLNYDLGGQATSYLRAASGNLNEALKTARENKGGRIGSGTIDDGYISQLEYLNRQAEQSLEKAYGNHDIQAVYKEVQKQVAANESQLKKFAENLSQYAKTLPDSQPRFKAKIARDLAILHIAFGEADTSTGGKREHYDNARRYLETARNLDPQAPDYGATFALLSSTLR